MRIQEVVNGLHDAIVELNGWLRHAEREGLVVRINVRETERQLNPGQLVHIEVGTPVLPTPKDTPF